MMRTGSIKFFDDKKGYGFIVPDQGGEDVFLHRTGWTCDDALVLTHGQRVRFDTTPTPKGPKAIAVSPLATGEAQDALAS
jgi:cold shock protein